jgi:hypothetical protein
MKKRERRKSSKESTINERTTRSDEERNGKRNKSNLKCKCANQRKEKEFEGG